ncbi:hypothetical protein LCGC14_1157130 [marine sediment metagenome]|uniref:Uncharacterized protein n=1 Tax=marine sediment metagenome TaxID=412755 RepID=A0A0F9LYR2_9ZZZZ
MRKKVWLVRQDDGGYSIFVGPKPYLSDTWYNDCDNIIRNLCKNLVKQWFGLKKHIRIGTCIQGYFNVSFKPIMRKK